MWIGERLVVIFMLCPQTELGPFGGFWIDLPRPKSNWLV